MATSVPARLLGWAKTMPAVQVAGSHGGRGNVERHGQHAPALDPRPGEELGDVGAGVEIIADNALRLLRSVGLRHQADHPAGHGLPQVKRNSVGRIERGPGRVDVRAGEFALFDPAADGEGVGGIRTQINHRGKTAAQKHVGKLRIQRGRRFPLRHAPLLGLGEMDVGVPEPGRHDAMVAGNDLRVRRHHRSAHPRRRSPRRAPAPFHPRWEDRWAKHRCARVEWRGFLWPVAAEGATRGADRTPPARPRRIPATPPPAEQQEAARPICPSIRHHPMQDTQSDRSRSNPDWYPGLVTSAV